MQTSWRGLFLIVVAAETFHFAEWRVVLVVIGYVAFESLDQWLARRARAKAIGEAIDDVMYGWDTEPDDPEREEKEEWSRIKLTGKEQIIVARVADLLRQALR